MTHEKALELLHEYVKNPRTIAHCLSSEAVLRAIAKRLGQDENKWGLAGLLHDLDVELTHDKPEIHGHETIRILRQEGIDEEILDAIIRHNEMNNSGERTTVFHHALAAGETITGLVTATALVYPDKKVASVKTKSVVKRMKEKAFAASVNREAIMECERIGIPLPEFAELSINAMAGISEEIGL
ncbi:MAG: HDIG domain-containing protein [Bacteroidales bacterium]|nr:HDIG domain-containing protein [Bacteroidales bacterium]